MSEWPFSFFLFFFLFFLFFLFWISLKFLNALIQVRSGFNLSFLDHSLLLSLFPGFPSFPSLLHILLIYIYLLIISLEPF